MSFRRSLSIFPRPSEAAWYAALRVFRGWSERMPEDELVKRATRLGVHVAHLAGRPTGPFAAMGRGLAQTVYCRVHRISVPDRLDDSSRRRWEAFLAEASVLPRAIFVSAHLGPFQLQMDLLAGLPQTILFLYRSYRWRPLADQVSFLRLQSDRFRYADVRRPREIAKAIRAGSGEPSLAVLGDPGMPPYSARRRLPLFGLPVLDDFPVRMSVRLKLPVFVGGLFNRESAASDPRPGSLSTFGLDYVRIDPTDEESTSCAYASAMERAIRNSPSDWIHF